MTILTESQCRQEIVDHIALHQECSKEEAYDALRDKLSRNTFFKYLPKLINEGQIIVEHKNKRDTKLFVDKNNPLVSVPECLENFKRAYIQLLKASKKIIRERGFTRNSPALGITQTQSSKWTKNDYSRVILHECDMVAKHYVKLEEIIQSNQGFKNIKNTLHRLESVYSDVSNYATAFLIYNSMRIFSVLVDIIIHLSTILWPMMIRDKVRLGKLYSNVFSKVADIQMELSSFLNSIHTFSINDSHLLMEASPFINLFGIKRDYTILNMQNEIGLILKTIDELGRELRKYGYKGGKDMYEPFYKILKNRLERTTGIQKE